MQIISVDKTLRKIRIEDLKDCSSQSLITQAMKVGKLAFLMACPKKVCDLIGVSDLLADLSRKVLTMKQCWGNLNRSS